MSNIYLVACYGFIAWLFWKDMGWRKVGTRALLIPGAWIAIQGSRPVSYWLGYGSGESNPVTTLSFALFLVAAVIVLVRRKLNWGSLVQKNKAIFLIYTYLLLSVFWSEMPFASTKRLVKDFEALLIGLIFLTEINPVEAIRAVFVRVSYILFPLSVVFIKYFPHIGREANKAGENMFTGVTTQKNSLGETVFVLGLFLLWDFVAIYKGENRKGKKQQLAIRAGMLLMGLWLLVTCDSQTSMLCLVLGAVAFWGCGRLLRMRRGKAVLYAPAPLKIETDLPVATDSFRQWPSLADLPAAGSVINRGDPVVTVYARGGDAAACRSRLQQAASEAYARLRVAE